MLAVLGVFVVFFVGLLVREEKEVFAESKTYYGGYNGTVDIPARAINITTEVWGGGGAALGLMACDYVQTLTVTAVAR